VNLPTLPCSSCKKECFSELGGTYLLVLMGPGSVIVASLIALRGIESLAFVAVVFACTVASMIIIFGNYSGAVINPALSLSAGISRLIRARLLVPYIFFQIVGGLLAGVTLRYLFFSTPDVTSLGSTKLASGIGPIAGIGLEAIGTFFLAMSALIASTSMKKGWAQALVIGGTLFVLIMLIGPLTGASFNPARSLGPSLLSGYLSNLYVFIAGPAVGAVAAGLVFRVIRQNGKARSAKNNPVCLC
jgi:glycerol uptake facilitator-like aquaporin